MLDLKRREIQLLAGEAWRNNNHIGTVEIATSIGKTWIALDAIMTLPKDSKVLFLAETLQREIDLHKDIEKYNSVFGVDILKWVDLEFACYQSAYRWENRAFDLTIGDEIHSCMSLEYIKFFHNNVSKKILGLSATVRSKKKYMIDNEEVTKFNMLEKIAPVCYTYDIGEAQRDGASRKLNIHVIYNQLDKVTRNIEGGSKVKRFMTTEFSTYNYLDNKYWEYHYAGKFKLARMFVAKRANLLYSLPSKVKIVKELLKHTKDKTLIFNTDIPTLELITDNVIRSARKGESVKLRNEINTQLREYFDKGKIKLLGAFNMLLQGANLEALDNVIVMSYFSDFGRFVQIAGRLRKNKGKVGNLYIIVTKDTQEEKWFEEITKDIPMEEFNVQYYNNVNEIKFE